jgi:transcriptional adapter 2-alpha
MLCCIHYIDLKLKVLEIYNSKLDARAERKKFILQRGLLERRDKKRSKEEKEVYNNMRVFARFHSEDEHEQFVQGLISMSFAHATSSTLQNLFLIS